MWEKTLLVTLSCIVLNGCLDLDLQLSDEMNWPDGSPIEDVDAGDGEDASADATPTPDSESADGWPIGADSNIVDETPPWFLPAIGCTSEETVLGSFCVALGPAGVALRLWASEPVVATLSIDSGGPQVDALAPASEHRLVITGLSPNREISLLVAISDGGGNEVTEGPLAVRTSSIQAPVVINEVLLDPLGPEPGQEMIEIFNYGSTPQSIDGWTISDESSSDPLIAPTAIPAAGFALIVGASYIPGSGGDAPPAAGALVIVLDSAIGTAGLRNSGESVELRNAAGELISLFPTPSTTPAAGASIERVDPQAPDGDPGNWRANPASRSTPGAVNDATTAEGE